MVLITTGLGGGTGRGFTYTTLLRGTRVTTTVLDGCVTTTRLCEYPSNSVVVINTANIKDLYNILVFMTLFFDMLFY
jgi:hypothetical protein